MQADGGGSSFQIDRRAAVRLALKNHSLLGTEKREQQLLALFLKGFGDIFQEDEAESDVLVFRGVHVPAHLVGCRPKLGFEVERGAARLLVPFAMRAGSLLGKCVRVNAA